MRYPKYLLPVALLAIVGCRPGDTTTSFQSLDQLKQTKDFEGYDVVVQAKIQGPYKVVSITEPTEVLRDPVKVRFSHPAKDQVFSLEYDGALGHAVRYVIVDNPDGESDAMLLMSVDKVAKEEPEAPATGGGRRGGGRRGGRGGFDPAQFKQRIMERDTNGDGKISKEEASERMQQNFDQNDTNGDGFLDEEEIDKMIASFGNRGRGRGRGGDAAGGGNAQGGDEKGGDNKTGEKTGDTKGDTGKSDAKGGDAKGGDAKGGDAKGGDAKGGDAKGDAGKGDDKGDGDKGDGDKGDGDKGDGDKGDGSGGGFSS